MRIAGTALARDSDGHARRGAIGGGPRPGRGRVVGRSGSRSGYQRQRFRQFGRPLGPGRSVVSTPTARIIDLASADSGRRLRWRHSTGDQAPSAWRSVRDACDVAIEPLRGRACGARPGSRLSGFLRCCFGKRIGLAAGFGGKGQPPPGAIIPAPASRNACSAVFQVQPASANGAFHAILRFNSRLPESVVAGYAGPRLIWSRLRCAKTHRSWIGFWLGSCAAASGGPGTCRALRSSEELVGGSSHTPCFSHCLIAARALLRFVRSTTWRLLPIWLHTLGV